LYGRAEVGGARAFDYARPAVDGGVMSAEVDERFGATMEVIRIERLLGSYDAAITRFVLCQGLHLTEVAALLGLSPKATPGLAAALDLFARVNGLRGTGPRRKNLAL